MCRVRETHTRLLAAVFAAAFFYALFPASAGAVDILSDEELSVLYAGSITGERGLPEDSLLVGTGLVRSLAVNTDSLDEHGRTVQRLRASVAWGGLESFLGSLQATLASAFSVFDEILPLNVFRGLDFSALDLAVTFAEPGPAVLNPDSRDPVLARIRFEGSGTLPGFRMNTYGGSLTMGGIRVERLSALVTVRR